mmetsp:Transcript_27025/g.59340  ORF Transcript_27025/g.59340 Transcript_27025/m.59340 type:complete len:223 (-) Transcript_27025:33-701(-)
METESVRSRTLLSAAASTGLAQQPLPQRPGSSAKSRRSVRTGSSYRAPSRGGADVLCTPSARSQQTAPSQRSGHSYRSGQDGFQSRVSSVAASSRRSIVGDLPPPVPFQPPTKAVLGCRESSVGSDTSSVRTATTIREFFAEDHRWAGSNSARSRSLGNRLQTPAQKASYVVSAAEAASVLPGLPPGKIPGVPCTGPRHDLSLLFGAGPRVPISEPERIRAY